MKVSSDVNITRIYQDQVKKAKADKPDGEFRKMMQDSTSKSEGPVRSFHPPSGVNPNNPILSGTPVAQADPVDTIKFAAEVVASAPEVRADRVDHIKKLFDAGQYNVAPEAVAEKLFVSGAVTRSWEG